MVVNASDSNQEHLGYKKSGDGDTVPYDTTFSDEESVDKYKHNVEKKDTQKGSRGSNLQRET